jgi:LysR family transcriptional regulator (chromosome initiation inhibitor)
MNLLSPQLAAFVAVAKCKTVHGAAYEIHLTQTAVTQRIRSLERALRTTLFIRSRRGMLLTQEGEALLHYCQAASVLEGEALAKIQGLGEYNEIELTISAPTSIMQARIMPNCVAVIKQFPQVLMRFQVNDVENRHQALRLGQCDFAVVQKEHLAQEMAYKQLMPEQYVLVCSPKWQDRKLTDIISQERIIDFDPSDQLTLNYLKFYGLFDLAKQSRYFVNRTESLAQLVAQGVGYTTLAKEFARPYVEQGLLYLLNDHKTYELTSLLAWYKRHAAPKYFNAIIDAIA